MASECAVVVPLENAEPYLQALHLRLTATLKRLAIPYEILYVDNGSTDRTTALIDQLRQQDPAVRGIILSRRFTIQAAMSAGLAAAQGRAVVTLDSNLQDPPEVIPRLLEAWHQGCEIVFARRRTRTVHRAVGWLGQRILRLLSETTIPAHTGDTVLMDRRVVEELNALPERTRFLTGLRTWVGFRQTVMEYDPHPQLAGNTRRSTGRQIRNVFETLLCFSKAPLKAVTLLGAIVTTVAGWHLLTMNSTTAAGTSSSLAPALILLGGVQLLCLGTVGHYVSRIYDEVRGRPLYIVRQRIGFLQHPRAVRNILQFLPGEAATRHELATRRRLHRSLSPEPTGHTDHA